MTDFLEKLWYGSHPLQWVLRHFSWIWRLISVIRRRYLQQFRQSHFPVPIIVVGNISVGGVGKTPLVIDLAKRLQAKGIKTGIVSRGYGAAITQFPYERPYRNHTCTCDYGFYIQSVYSRTATRTGIQ